jgi:hypothetical protein
MNEQVSASKAASFLAVLRLRLSKAEKLIEDAQRDGAWHGWKKFQIVALSRLRPQTHNQ